MLLTAPDTISIDVDARAVHTVACTADVVHAAAYAVDADCSSYNGCCSC